MSYNTSLSLQKAIYYYRAAAGVFAVFGSLSTISRKVESSRELIDLLSLAKEDATEDHCKFVEVRPLSISGGEVAAIDLSKKETVFVYRVETPVKSEDLETVVDKSAEFGYLKLDEWERVQRVWQSRRTHPRERNASTSVGKSASGN